MYPDIEALGEWNAAVDAHLAAASSSASIPLASVLGHTYAARSHDALGQFDPALGEYQTALGGWNTDYGPVYSLHRTQNPGTDDRVGVQARADVARVDLPGRIEQLRRAISVPGGTLLEKGRWLVEQRRHADALVPLDEFLARYRRSPSVSEARYLAHQARLGSALELADLGNPKRNDAAAIAQLDLIARDSYDFGVCAAKIAKATLLSKRGVVAEADALMLSALAEWYEHQRPQRDAPRDGIQTDVADIRRVIMRPSADGVLGDMSRSAFTGPPPVPFVIVNPDIPVKLVQTERVRLSVHQALPGTQRVVFVTADGQALLSDIVARLGSKPTGSRNAGEDVLELWNKFFKTDYGFGNVERPGYPRVLVETYPVIAELEFLDAARTRAAARIVGRSEGGTIILEKDRGEWVAREVVNKWIS